MREEDDRNAIATSQTLEPDGKTIGCNPIAVGSTPTGIPLRVQRMVDEPSDGTGLSREPGRVAN